MPGLLGKKFPAPVRTYSPLARRESARCSVTACQWHLRFSWKTLADLLYSQDHVAILHRWYVKCAHLGRFGEGGGLSNSNNIGNLDGGSNFGRKAVIEEGQFTDIRMKV
jgi:hypothetical protein